MKTQIMLIPLVFLCCLGCRQREEVATGDVEADVQAIKDVIAELEAAVNTKDVNRGMLLYTDNAVEIRPNEPALYGKEAILNRSRQEHAEIDIQDVYKIQNVKVSGDLAVAHVTWSATVTIKESGKIDNPQGNWIMVLEKQSDSTWKFIYEIWSDESLIHPPLPE